ncbi:MAG: EAL domain-containing protein [Eubacteriales bacterium]|nr:EAL domain-containing protein [Eubacteriales bacterium]
MKIWDSGALLRLTTFFESQKAFLAIRQGLTMMIPAIALGSFALMLKSLPIASYQAMLTTLFDGRLVELLDFIYGGTFQIFSVILAVTTSVSYAVVSKPADRTGRAIINDGFILATLTLISLMGYVGIQFEDFSVSDLGTTNTFMALLIALTTGWLYYKVRDSRLLRKLHRSDTDMGGLYALAVQSILPATAVVCVFAVCDQLFQQIFGVESLQDGLIVLMENVFQHISGSLPTGISILLSVHLMWFFGIHGSNVIDPVVQSHYTAVDGVTIYSKSFQDVFTIMGGCGASLALVLAILLFSRKRGMKNVAGLALPGVLFNISEVIVFGLPVIFNPIFFVPFVLSPILNMLVAYGATYAGLVPIVVNQVEWTTPVFLGGWQATGSLAGGFFQLALVVMDMCLYLPFIRMFERYNDQTMRRRLGTLVDLLREEEETVVTTSLLRREGNMGSVARTLANDLRAAIERRELYLLYQPQVDRDGRCLGAEALLRWEHPVVGYVYPPLIIRLARESDMLEALDRLIFDQAAAALAQVERTIDRTCEISVNITNTALRSASFETILDEAVERHGIHRERLWLEITEQDALFSSDEVAERVERLRAKGHRFLIDDFGMGHTSLHYLQGNDFTIVKLDGGITRDVVENARHQDILRSIVYLGQLLHFTTVAEFVETEAQTELLRSLGVDAFQGYYYSHPIPLSELLTWIEAH